MNELPVGRNSRPIFFCSFSPKHCQNATDAEMMKIAKAEPEKRAKLTEKLREPKPSAPKKKYSYNPQDYGCTDGLPFSKAAATEPHVSSVLCELTDVVETFIFRWDFQQEHHGHRSGTKNV